MKSIPYGYSVSAFEPIDDRLVLTKAQLLTAHEDFSLPDNYFAFCIDDNRWYEYSYAREEAGDLDPETGYYREVPGGLVNDVIFNGESVVVDKIATIDAVVDVKVDGSSVVSSEGIAEIDLAQKQDKLTAGQNIKIDNNVISVDGLKDYEPGYGIKIDSEGNVAIDTEVVPEKVEIPSKVSDLDNDLGFITKAVLDLENYYLKDETYSQQQIDALISHIEAGLELEVVAVLPLSGEDNKIYLVRRSIDSNIYDQYVWFNNTWVQVGSTEVDLSQYYTKTQIDDLLSQQLALKQNKLTNGAGISLNGSFISVDMGSTLTTTGNALDVKQATPYQKGVVAYDDNTIKMNANGQLYSTGGGGTGSYVAGPNIQISGNVISATDTTYRAGDGIEITGDLISAKTDNETIFTNRRGELYMDAVGIDTGKGIQISDDGVISIIPSDVANAIDLENKLDEKQDAFTIGKGLYWTENGTKLNATVSSEGGGPVDVTFSEIVGYPTDNDNLRMALNAKLGNIVAGSSNVTITKNGDTATISVSGGGSGASSFRDLSGDPYDNSALANALEDKQNKIDPSNKLPASNIDGLSGVATSGSYNDLSDKPAISNSQVAIYQGSALKGSFTLNQTNGSAIYLDAGGGGSTPNNGKLTIQRNGTQVQTFTANQASNVTANIKVPSFSYDSSTGVLTITDN